MRMTYAPRFARTDSQASKAVDAVPKWVSPVGLGAKRPRGIIAGEDATSYDPGRHPVAFADGLPGDPAGPTLPA
jgi:hypothetical protein